jgi:hypothetical protein
LNSGFLSKSRNILPPKPRPILSIFPFPARKVLVQIAKFNFGKIETLRNLVSAD